MSYDALTIKEISVALVI